MLEQEPDRIKFLVSIEGEKAYEIVAYNDIANFLEEEMSDTADQLWTFKEIIAHASVTTIMKALCDLGTVFCV